MGAGHGGWLSDSFCNGFYGGSMEVFTHLAALHFHHDCTDHLLGLITQRNSSTLKILDISFSQNVSDSSAKFIVNCQSLTELDIIGTSLSGQVRRFSFPFSAKQCSEGYLEFKMNSVNYESVKIKLQIVNFNTGIYPHYTEMRFVNFFSGGFINAIIINPPERKLEKRTSVHCVVQCTPSPLDTGQKI